MFCRNETHSNYGKISTTSNVTHVNKNFGEFTGKFMVCSLNWGVFADWSVITRSWTLLNSSMPTQALSFASRVIWRGSWDGGRIKEEINKDA